MAFVGLDFIKSTQAAQFNAAHPVTQGPDTIPPTIQCTPIQRDVCIKRKRNVWEFL
jgi:hypothetical protein